jgi:hypothetical protein
MKTKIGENLSREWAHDPHAAELWDALHVVKSDPMPGVEVITRLAENGSSLAMKYLAGIYLLGRYGVQKDCKVGEYWLRRSATEGSIEGGFDLAGYLYDSRRKDEAVAEYHHLADLGYSPAQFRLGWEYYSGRNVEKDLEKSFFYFRMAEKEGHLYAAIQVSNMLMRTENGPISWLRGLAKRIKILIPLLITTDPNSDRLRR